MPLRQTQSPRAPGLAPAVTSLHVPVARHRKLSELYSVDQMQHVLRRERSRSDRTGSRFALVVLKLRDPHGASQRRNRSLNRLAVRVLRLVRETDEVGTIEPGSLGVVLPDTDPIGASIFVARVKQLTAGTRLDPSVVVYVYPDQPPGDDDTDDRNGSGDDKPKARVSPEDSGMPIDFVPPEKVSAGLGSDPLANAAPSAPARPHRSAPPVAARESFANRAALEPTDVPIAAVAVRSMNELFAQKLPWWKRALDITVSGAAILATSPLMLAAALAIRLDSDGPVVFKQKRMGLGGVPFTIFKFRTMCTDAEAKQRALKKFSEQDGPAFKLKNDPRITRVGAFLRKTSIDELPQLFNILRGDMTLVGPRPLPVHEATAVDHWQARRHDVTPGLTCIWQVEGRSRVKFDEWMRMDMRYARRRSLISDLSLVLRTVPAVLLRRGAN